MTTGQIELEAIAERLTQVEREIADIKQGSGSRQTDSEPWYLKHAGRSVKGSDMVSEHSMTVAQRAKSIYFGRLQSQLMAEHPDEYVAIEPDSGDFFVAHSFSDAVRHARTAHPDRISFVIRIGHEAAIHIGAATT